MDFLVPLSSSISAAQTLLGPDVHVQLDQRCMPAIDARDALVDMADIEHIDILAIGTRGLGALSRVLLGSTADYLTHHCHCSVSYTCSRNFSSSEFNMLVGGCEYRSL